MSKHEMVKVSGVVEHVFAHRFTVRTDKGVILADMTPKGLENVVPKPGDSVVLEGEQKPSEIKVSKITLNRVMIEIGHDEKSHKKHKAHDRQDVAKLKAVVEKAGYETLGPSHDKPKHVEFLAKKDGETLELHVALDGEIYKVKPADATDHKWASH